MSVWSSNIIRGIHYKTGKPIEVIIKDGKINMIHEISSTHDTKHIISPGLVDIQVNGYMGIDFNKAPLTEKEWVEITRLMLQNGVTTFYPTVITNSFTKLSEIFKENIKYLINSPINANIVGGFHLEGPYISKEDGPRGAHAEEFIRAPDWDEFCSLQEKSQGKIKILTLSPEWDGAQEFIEKATKNGVKVAIGHTSANTKQIHRAVKAGATLATHIGNGAHPMLPRHPNYIWDQLAEEKMFVSVIPDGKHLPENVLKVIEKIKGKQMILISDSVSIAGMDPGDYKTHIGGEVTLTSEGSLHLKNYPRLLAGSVQNLLHGVKYMTDKKITGLSEALNKASIYPSKVMDLPQQAGLTIGAPADIILLEKDLKQWNVLRTYKNGELVFKNKKGC